MVNFQVKSNVNSQKKADEELTITITTNGSVKPKKTLQEALELSKSSFNKIADLINSEKKEKLIAETK
jgi:DNA-directed RNA polymerase alpha subunit